MRTRMALAAMAVAAALAALVAAEGGLRLLYGAAAEPLTWTNHPVLGHWLKPNIRFAAGAGPERHQFATDPRGIIVRRSLDRPGRAVTVLLLGDSMLEGLQVAPDDNLSERLAALMSVPCRCVNLGLSGFSPLRYLLAYEVMGRGLAPDYVLVFFTILNDYNDDARLYHEGRILTDSDGRPVGIRPTFDCATGTYWGYHAGVTPMSLGEALRECPGPVSLMLVRRQILKRTAGYGLRLLGPRVASFNGRDADLLRDNVHAIFKDAYAPKDWEDIRRSHLYLRWLHERVVGEGRRLIVVVAPYAGQIPGALAGADEGAFGQRADQLASDRPQRVLGEFLRSAGIPFLDLLPGFRRAQGRLFGERDKHLAALGHQVVADEVYRFMGTTFDGFR